MWSKGGREGRNTSGKFALHLFSGLPNKKQKTMILAAVFRLLIIRLIQLFYYLVLLLIINSFRFIFVVGDQKWKFVSIFKYLTKKAKKFHINKMMHFKIKLIKINQTQSTHRCFGFFNFTNARSIGWNVAFITWLGCAIVSRCVTIVATAIPKF